MSQNCVLKGTLITLENDETIEIENLKVGQKILSYSIEDIENTPDIEKLDKNIINEFDGYFSYQIIKNIWKNQQKEYYNINNSLFITGDHYIFSKRGNEYSWKEVEKIKIGDFLFKSDNIFEKITSIKIINIEDTNFYNLEVNSIYTYFSNGYLIHNAGSSGSSCIACGSDCSGGGGGKK